MTGWTIIIITIIFSAFFSGMEIAFINANKLKVEVDKSKGSYAAGLISNLNKSPSRFIGALLLGNNVALVIYGIAMAELLKPAIISFAPPALQTGYFILLIQTILSTLLILIAAEFIPKALFRLNPNAILNFFAVPVYLFYVVFYPIVYVFIGFAKFLIKVLFRIKFQEGQYDFTPVDLDYYLKEFSTDVEGEDELQHEIQMFQNVIDFRHVKLRECMIPRPEIVAIDVNYSVDKLKQKFIETGFSRILIYDESIDNIIGYTHAYDMFRNPTEVNSIYQPILIVPETMLANNVLATFIQEHKSVALVVDEFGGTSGMVTMEDIIEEIFGEIVDEYDVEGLIDKQTGKNEYIFSARVEIDFINEKYKLDIPESEEYETLAGFIINHHQSIPELKEEIYIEPYLFTILQASDTRIEKVKVEVRE